MSASQVIIALGGIIYPTLSEKMLALYGFRGKYYKGKILEIYYNSFVFMLGAAAIIGALSLHSIVGMTLMHPVEWHAKKPEEVHAERAREREQKIFRELATTNRRSTIDVIHLSSKTKWSSLRSLKEENSTEMPLIENLKVT